MTNMDSNRPSNKLMDQNYRKKKYSKLTNSQKPKNKQLFVSTTDTVTTVNSKNFESPSSQASHSVANITNNLTEFEITNKNFTKFQMLSCAKNLKKLTINNGTMKSIPNEFAELQNLSVLNLRKNQLSVLPNNLCTLKNLEVLNLSYNELNDLPICYGNLQRLRHLDISGNKFNVLPKCITNGMATLRILNVSENSNMIMNIIPYSKYLEIFYAQKNKYCKNFPDWTLAQKLFNLRKLYFDETVFDVFSFVGKEGKLCITSFSMHSSNLTSPILEEILKNMVKVEKICVGNTQIKVKKFNIKKFQNIFNNIPIHVMKNPSIIKELNFCATNLPSVPPEINQLQHLKKLNLSKNCISWLPNEFCELYELEYLKIDGNKLIMFPENIGNLNLLREIRAENNLLMKLPKSFKDLKNLYLIDLYDNKFDEFPNVLSELSDLKYLDLEQNFFTTSDVKIKEVPYSTFYEAYSSLNKENSEELHRCLGNKNYSSDESDNLLLNNFHSSDDEENDNIVYVKPDMEENWDSLSDSDSEFNPESQKQYNIYPKNYILPVFNGFCPADWHSKKVTDEVASMCQYGSLPTYIVEEGQFDDV